MVDACHAEGLSDWATHGVLTALRAVLRFAREHDLMTADPFSRVPRDRLPAQRSRSETKALRPEEASLVLDRLRAKPSGGREYALGCLLVDAGLRSSEACGLTWADVSLTERVLHVRGQLAPLKAGEQPMAAASARVALGALVAPVSLLRLAACRGPLGAPPRRASSRR